MHIDLRQGDCLEVMKKLKEEGKQVDAVITDPPYHFVSIQKRFKETSLNDNNKTGENARNKTTPQSRLSRGFMGKEWDGGDIAFRPETWELAYDLLKPGGHLLAFGAPKNFHRLAVAIEDAGFEIRDTVMWMFGTGFPKSHNISKGIDKHLGLERTEVIGVKPGHENFVDRETSSVKSLHKDGALSSGFSRPWMNDPDKVEKYHYETAPVSDEAKTYDGWGTALKPAYEPIILARKPLIGTVAENVLKYGTGGINIDATRVPIGHGNAAIYGDSDGAPSYDLSKGRFPANVIHDGSDEVINRFPITHGAGKSRTAEEGTHSGPSGMFGIGEPAMRFGDSGSTARFFYSAKTSKKERGEGNNHPTVKPVVLMEYLVKLITPPNGTVLDPFMGSGSTGIAVKNLGFSFIGIEKDADYFKISENRIEGLTDTYSFDIESE